MWLLNVHTYKLEADMSNAISLTKPYAILSHTWGEDEVTFKEIQDMSNAADQSSKRSSHIRKKTGYWKIMQTCEQARRDGLVYAWLDTCCIDKSSSAELQEAINSMFTYYAQASKCYAYLSDVDAGSFCGENRPTAGNFESSRWWTRGWTLQELIAPQEVVFFARGWTTIGTRADHKVIIEQYFGIDISILGSGPLLGQSTSSTELESTQAWRPPLASFSVARRMSWAADRQTTRVEDRAYSLLGIFGINLPLLYGEGPRAFIRLQDEILRTSPDLSLLLWNCARSSQDYEGAQSLGSCLLAASPRLFRARGDIRFVPAEHDIQSAAERTISSVGLKARVRLLRAGNDRTGHGHEMHALLSCYDQGSPTTTVGLFVTVDPALNKDHSAISQRKESDRPLFVTPRAIQPSESWWRLRFKNLDAVFAETDSFLQTVIFARETTSFDPKQIQAPRQIWLAGKRNVLSTPESVTPQLPEGQPMRTVHDRGVHHVWLPARTLHKQNAAFTPIMCYPATAWNMSNLLFDTSQSNEEVALDSIYGGRLVSVPFTVGAIAMTRSDCSDRIFVVVFASLMAAYRAGGQAEMLYHDGFYFRIDCITGTKAMVSPEILRARCTQLVREDIQVKPNLSESGTRVPYHANAFICGRTPIRLEADVRRIGDKRFAVVSTVVSPYPNDAALLDEHIRIPVADGKVAVGAISSPSEAKSVDDSEATVTERSLAGAETTPIVQTHHQRMPPAVEISGDSEPAAMEGATDDSQIDRPHQEA